MPLLIVVSLLWAFSFGLTKGRLAGLDSAFISAARLGLALLVFLPFLRFRGLTPRLAAALAAIGAVQFGLMYLAFNESYRHLQAYEIVLLTITTPILVTLLADAWERTLRLRALAAALLAVAGAAFVVVRSPDFSVTLVGVALVQASNAAFALGQVSYRRLRLRHPALRDRDVFAWLYLGAFLVALLACAVKRPTSFALAGPQVATLAYLGVLASGVGFFLWNVGATRVSAGALAVMNNAKVPLGVAVSLFVFGETADVATLAASFVLLAGALWLLREPRNAR